MKLFRNKKFSSALEVFRKELLIIQQENLEGFSEILEKLNNGKLSKDTKQRIEKYKEDSLFIKDRSFQSFKEIILRVCGPLNLKELQQVINLIKGIFDARIEKAISDEIAIYKALTGIVTNETAHSPVRLCYTINKELLIDSVKTETEKEKVISKNEASKQSKVLWKNRLWDIIKITIGIIIGYLIKSCLGQ